MFAFYRELEGTAHLTLHAFKRVGMLRVPPVMEEFMRQVYFTGGTRSMPTRLKACSVRCAVPSSSR